MIRQVKAVMRAVSVILLIVLTGCAADNRTPVYNFEESKMFSLPPGTRCEWQDTKIDELPEEQQDVIASRYIVIINGELAGDVKYTEDWGYFISRDILDKVLAIQAEEDLSMTIWERIWKGLGL